MVAWVARGEVGIVMSFELSRLSRNDLDWHHLVYLCRWTNTLIADEQGLYDPSSTNDRMVLGIRGQVSELERDSLVHRMVEARWNKARRGEAFTIPPAGYELDDLGQLQFSSDEAVQAAVRRVFEKFDQLGAARQVFLWWRSEGLNFPVRQMVSRTHSIVWRSVCYRLIHQMLRHPIYAGAFVFGRSESRRELDPETQKVVLRRGLRRAREEWPVLIQDHHPGYISFETYLDNQERLRGNAMMTSQPTDESHQGAPRGGRALLQGLMRCGHCGRRMYVNYGGNNARRTLQYRCSRQRLLEPECQLVGGKRIEATVVEAFLLVAQAAGPEAAALAGERLRAEIETAERAWKLRIEKAEYEAQRPSGSIWRSNPKTARSHANWSGGGTSACWIRDAGRSGRKDESRPAAPDRNRAGARPGSGAEPGGGLACVHDYGTRPKAPLANSDRRGAGAVRGATTPCPDRVEGRRGDGS